MQRPEDVIRGWGASSGYPPSVRWLAQMWSTVRSMIYGGRIRHGVFEQKERVERPGDTLGIVSRRRLQHCDQKWLAMVFDKISCSLWMTCRRPQRRWMPVKTAQPFSHCSRAYRVARRIYKGNDRKSSTAAVLTTRERVSPAAAAGHMHDRKPDAENKPCVWLAQHRSPTPFRAVSTLAPPLPAPYISSSI